MYKAYVTMERCESGCNRSDLELMAAVRPIRTVGSNPTLSSKLPLRGQFTQYLAFFITLLLVKSLSVKSYKRARAISSDS
jgi:hypothetical protein